MLFSLHLCNSFTIQYNFMFSISRSCSTSYTLTGDLQECFFTHLSKIWTYMTKAKKQRTERKRQAKKMLAWAPNGLAPTDYDMVLNAQKHKNWTWDKSFLFSSAPIKY